MYRRFGKRSMDVVCSVLGLLVLWPLLLVLILLVRARLGKPAIFRQERPGKDGKIFTLYKFRTMTDERDAEGTLLPDAERLTSFGKKLRASSLDELPELFNILKGDMSVVGPRPLLVEYLPLYNETEKRRHEVRPGLTGYAQVNGRNALTWDQKFEFDVFYVDHVSIPADLKIIGKTLGSLLSRRGIHSAQSATMEPFAGHEEMPG